MATALLFDALADSPMAIASAADDVALLPRAIESDELADAE